MKKILNSKHSAAILFTGGKDSCLALHLAIKKYQINYLLTIIPRNFDSFMFHKPYLNLLERQSENLGIDLLIKESEGVKEKELVDLESLIKEIRNKTDVIVVGGIASSYQGNRIKKICHKLGLKFYAPLWNYTPEKIWKELLDKKFKVILTKISCEGIPKEFLGMVIDRKKLEELRRLGERYKFRIDFEGGEAESAVLGMPEFKKDIIVKYKIKSENVYRHWIDIEDVK
ncbi:diphthine--ammonia ligase [Candidatus Pacearchaeota archaeon]|nr:diphthine--ammonia ligase [Candidatus Pacearchaeota archaeon]MBD3283652.1 diphthine--ammonia ligase [Candidatus Pacearchaeota archaeon]